MSEFEEAKDKVMMGSERKSMAMSEEEKKLTAYHEAGHAVVGLYVPAGIPIHKATIIPRGQALGMVMYLPESDKLSTKYIECTSRLASVMGGRVAEEITFGKENITGGASSDIRQATRMARAMVTQLGFSDKLGKVAYGENNDEVFLGMSMGRQPVISEATAQIIDAEVKRLIDQGYEDATRILTEHREEFIRLAEALLEYETLTGEECKTIMRGEKISRKSDDDGNAPAGSAVPSAGRTRPRGEPTGGMEPQPQT